MGGLEATSMSSFSNVEWDIFYDLRCILGSKYSKMMMHCQFAACGSRVRVKTADFKQVVDTF